MALPAPVERGYLDLLAQLREGRSRISSETLQAAITFYLVCLPATQPTPTPLTASIIASPVWQPLSLSACLALGGSFRTATRQKLIDLKKRKRGFFEPSVSSELATWIREICAGLKDGDAILRIAISGGLFLGVRDLEKFKVNQRPARDIEEIMVLAFAEATEASSALCVDEWTHEFKHSSNSSKGSIELATLLAGQYFNAISTEALSALNLRSLASSCLVLVEKAFTSGSYLYSACEDLQLDPQRSLVLSPQSNLVKTVNVVLASDYFTCVAHTCRLITRIVAVIPEKSFRAEKRRELWSLLNETSQRLNEVSDQVERDWCTSTLSQVRPEDPLEPNMSELTGKIWSILKTQLFSTVMLQQCIVDTILFVPPPPAVSSESTIMYSPFYLTSTILRTLSCLSFVIASFGGVAAGSSDVNGKPSFPELKKAFYMSIDILSTDKQESGAFVLRLITDTDACCAVSTANSPFRDAKRSFALQCIEQFVPVLEDTCIERDILPFCEPHLGDPAHRETYESAHSVMLSIFAAHAERYATGSPSYLQKHDLEGKGIKASEIELARRLVPGYARSLLENAKEGGLTISQLRLAYAALVRSASTGKNPHSLPSTKSTKTTGTNAFYRWWRTLSNPDTYEEFLGDPALAWLCVEQLLESLSNARDVGDQQSHFALALTLISLISNVSLTLLPRVLAEVECVVDEEADVARKKVLIENVFEEIMERVGDIERSYAMKRWYDLAKKWEVPSDGPNHEEQSI